MKSISGKNWEEIFVNKRLIEKEKIDNNFNDIQAKLIISRNFSREEIYSVNNQINISNPFMKNKDFLLAYKLLKKIINKNEKVLIIGDYDVDGCVSTSLMVNFLNNFNLDVEYYIPDRFIDGYGANKDLIEKLISKKRPQLIILLDCGTNSYEAIDFIKKCNINSIIIDHHNVKQPFPESDIFINPKKNFKNDYMSYLCSASLTFYFIDFFIKQDNSKILFNKNLIFVLLAIVADIMPLRGLNRIVAINVLNKFKLSDNFVIQELSKLLKIKKKIDIDDLAYLFAPIINSAGRMTNANQIVELLTTKSKNRVLHILKKLIILNAKRKIVEKKYLDEIDFDKLTNQNGVIFVYKKNISEGLIGIIASRIKEYFNKPCVVLTNSDNLVKGSARSTLDFNIGEYIHIALKKNILIKGGGHNLAAGMSLHRKNINLFKDFLDHIYKKDEANLNYNYISKISLHSINKDFIKRINQISPFGNKNSNPTFLIENLKIIKPTLLKDRFISCYIKSSNKLIKAISFNYIQSNISNELFNSKKKMNLLVKIKENNWNNKSSIQLQIIDIIKSTNNT